MGFFLDKVNSFFDAAIASLPEDQKKQLDEIMENYKGTLLAGIITSLEKNLPDNHKTQFKANIDRLIQ